MYNNKYILLKDIFDNSTIDYNNGNPQNLLSKPDAHCKSQVSIISSVKLIINSLALHGTDDGRSALEMRI